MLDTKHCVEYKITYMDKKHSLTKSDVIEEIPLACSDELTAVEFFEKQRWGDTPRCVQCGSLMCTRCGMPRRASATSVSLALHDCQEQYTVRIGTVYEESRSSFVIGAMRSAPCTSKRASPLWRSSGTPDQLQVGPIPDESDPLRNGTGVPTNPSTGTVECRRMYMGGKPR